LLGPLASPNLAPPTVSGLARAPPALQLLQLVREEKLQLVREETPVLQLLREVKRRCCSCCAGVAAVAPVLQLLREVTLAL